MLRNEEDHLTLHKICVLILIEKYGALRRKYWGVDLDNEESSFRNLGPHLPPKERKATCILVSKVIQENDMSFDDLLDVIEASGIPDVQISLFHKGLKEICTNGIESFLALFDSIEKFATQDVSRSQDFPCLWTSLVGLHLRKLMLAFRCLNFSHVTSLYSKFCIYYENGMKGRDDYESSRSSLLCNESKLCESSDFDQSMSICASEVIAINYDKSEVDEDMKTPTRRTAEDKVSETDHLMGILSRPTMVTRTQAEHFIQDEILLLLQQDPKALHPRELQTNVNNILKLWPDLGKGHFASFLNCLRVGEFAGSVHSLIRAYDSKFLKDDIGRGEDTTKSFRYASLNMAALQAQFGHRSQGLLHLEECIRLSQENTDHTCLQHALAWLYTLSDTQKSVLMKRSYTRSSELGLPYLSWLGSLNYTMQKAKGTTAPQIILKKLLTSPSNCPNPKSPLEGGVEGAAAEWCSQASLWALWGQLPLTAMCSHMVLNGGTKNVSSGGAIISPDFQSPTCTAICNMALILHDMGETSLSRIVLEHCKTSFPSWPQNHNWMFTESMISFKQAINMGEWVKAETITTAMATTHPTYSKLLKCQLLSRKGELSQAFDLGLSKEIKEAIDNADPFVKVNFLMSMAEALSGGSNCGSACDTLSYAIQEAKSHHMSFLAALAQLQLASVQLHLGLVSLAQESLKLGLNVVLSGGGLYDQSRALLLKAKVEVRSLNALRQKESLFNIANSLDRIQNQFSQVKAFHRQKETLYIKARLYHECSAYRERNLTALQFKQLEQQHPSQTIMANTCVF